MRLFFAGAEIPGWRTLLADNEVENVALSYVGMRRRSKQPKPFLLKDKFPDSQAIYVDSGAYTLNKAEEGQYSQGEIEALANDYFSFVAENIDRLDMVSEFDALPLGLQWIREHREDFWDDLDPAKVLPIWHAEWGLDDLDKLAQTYPRIGITQTDLDGRNLAPVLNGLVQRYGTRLHGVAMTKPDELRAVRWDSAASTSWISPSRFGDTIVWVNNELKRYPRKYKDQARKRHRTLFEKEGFDAEAIAQDDTTEVLRLSIWSWRQLESSLNRQVVTTTPYLPSEENTETGLDVVGTDDLEKRNSVATPRVINRRPDSERQVLPVLGLRTEKRQSVTTDGTSQEEEVSTVFLRSDSMRVCDTCFISAKCPAVMPGSNCAYDIPVTIRTRDDYRSMADVLIEMQSQRVLILKMFEDMEGGYADPNLSKEIKLLQDLIKNRHEMDQEGFTLTVEAKAKGQAGMISRLFGREAGDQVMSLPSVIDGNALIEAAGSHKMSDLPRGA